MDLQNIFPRWMSEFRRSQNLKSQIFLYGNVYDCYYFPVNHNQAQNEEELEWSKFPDIKTLMRRYLFNENYEIVAYYDIIMPWYCTLPMRRLQKTQYLNSYRMTMKKQKLIILLPICVK